MIWNNIFGIIVAITSRSLGSDGQKVQNGHRLELFDVLLVERFHRTFVFFLKLSLGFLSCLRHVHRETSGSSFSHFTSSWSWSTPSRSPSRWVVELFFNNSSEYTFLVSCSYIFRFMHAWIFRYLDFPISIADVSD